MRKCVSGTMREWAMRERDDAEVRRCEANDSHPADTTGPMGAMGTMGTASRGDSMSTTARRRGAGA